MCNRGPNGLFAFSHHGCPRSPRWWTWWRRHVLAAATAASRLSRTFAILVETLRRLRSGGGDGVCGRQCDCGGGGETGSGENPPDGGRGDEMSGRDLEQAREGWLEH